MFSLDLELCAFTSCNITYVPRVENFLVYILAKWASSCKVAGPTLISALPAWFFRKEEL